jgi:hypothetical protein
MKPNKSALAILCLSLLALFPLFAVLFTVGWALRGAIMLCHKLKLIDSGGIPAASR